MASLVQEKLVSARELLRRSSARAEPIDLAGLERALRAEVDGEVRFDRGSRGVYSLDASNYFEVPLGVVIPRTAEATIATVGVCRRFGAPITSRAGGTSLAGQTCNNAVVIDCSKYLTRILELNPREHYARVQMGVICDDVVRAASVHDLTWGPQPSTHDHCCFGGMLANNAGGMHAQLSGIASQNTEEMDVVLYDGTRMHVGWMTDDELDAAIARGGRTGQIYRDLKALRERYGNEIRRIYPNIPRRVSGYNLNDLLPGEDGRFNIARALVGSEGTLVTMLEAKVRLVYDKPERVVVALGFDDIGDAGDEVPTFLRYEPTALEAIDHKLHKFIEIMGGERAQVLDLLPPGKAWLFIELGAASREEAITLAHRVLRHAKHTKALSTKLIPDKSDQKRIWKVREAGLGVTAFVPGSPDSWPGWEDSAVAPDKVGGYVRELRKLFERYDYDVSIYGHFGMGCIHCRIPFDLASGAGIAKFRSFMEDASNLVHRFGGSFSGEHGGGQARGELLVKMFGPDLIQAFREYKRIWDPDWKMNPGKLVDARPLDANLRIGADYAPKPVRTHFKYPDDHGSFAHATLRCVGIGECRRTSASGENQTMCPSYMVTRDEKHTTRGRAHLLWEMVTRGPIDHGWADEAVKESLDLCLSCKGCKGDCPVHVDVATHKAEFLSHYYEVKRRPRQAYAFGFVDQWSRIASLAPGLANLATQTPGLRALAKFAANVPQARQLPPFAPETFEHWFKTRGSKQTGAPKVVLFADTFNNHFFPRTAKAAVHVLENAGYEVIVPDGQLCCGRPLYDYGFVDQAKRYAEKVMAVLRPHLEAGRQVVVLEPSCASVFRDEVHNLWPDRKEATELAKQTKLLSEFLREVRYDPPHLDREAIIQGHCHQKSVLGMEDEEALLAEMGLDARQLDSGCCGMAGSFGYERGDKYEVSIACGERVLLPEVRKAKTSTLIVADGFSCREQISQETDRHGLHLAEVIEMALRDGRQGPRGDRPPEQQLVTKHRREVRRSMTRAMLALAGATVVVAILSRAMRR
jgi:FAD/FMN-containing dehydrogenase/Fe-S oxidoreductase